MSAYGNDQTRGATQKEIVQSTLRDGSWHGEDVNYDEHGNGSILDSRTTIVRNDEDNPIALCGVATDITNRKKSEKEQEEYLTEPAFENNAILHSSRMSDVDDICDYIGRTVYAVNPRSVVVVSLYDQSIDEIVIKSVFGLHQFIKKMLRIVGFDPRTLRIKQDEMGENAPLYVSGKRERIPGGLYAILEKKIPKPICKQVERLFNLDAVYGIVKQHDGTIRIESSPGEGTAFRVYLPVSRKKKADHRPRRWVYSQSVFRRYVDTKGEGNTRSVISEHLLLASVASIAIMSRENKFHIKIWRLL